ncbi:PREDICTED: elongation of fatty acids protein 3-like [Lupinus angustifolius]|uniref:elongation of fatty acids protein 3-like n=1 Tax=Lupinus angustifolius TaxID=3871 RepID=UPI00092ED806|nr:PREDICTED: elongation of fatty acids protein 3-like [Lupinus angustifolius]
MANSVIHFLQQWLVYHPTILNFSWNPPLTPFSSLSLLSFSLLSYLSLSLLLPSLPLPPLSPRFLKPITALHSLSLFLISLIMSFSTILTIFSHTPHPHWILCFPPHTKPIGPLFFWAYIFYLSKFLELIDTLLIILSRNFRRLSFLHVYHHATVLVMCYLWLHTSQSLFPIALVTNASVHVIMYGYYFVTALGVRPRWKRVVTDSQIVQFVFSFVVSVVMLYKHLYGEGCSGIWGWCFNALFNASLLALFVDFHRNSYAHRNKSKLNVKTD